MRNIYVLPTDKPSRLYSYYGMLEDLSYGKTFTIANEEVAKINLHKDLKEYQENLIKANWKAENIYITSDEEIKEGDFCIGMDGIFQYKGKVNIPDIEFPKKIILTTDQDLIADGVQAIDDEFLEWFIKNPSCEEVEVREIEVEDYVGFAGHTSYPTFHKEYKIIIPKEEAKRGYVKSETEFLGIEITLEDGSKQFVPKQKCVHDIVTKFGVAECQHCGLEESEIISLKKKETLEEAAERLHPEEWDWREREIFIDGAKWQAERMYSEEEVIKILDNREDYLGTEPSVFDYLTNKEWFKKFKKK